MRCAPKAMRTPISRVRPATVYDMIPYSPMQASNKAKPAKNAESLANVICSPIEESINSCMVRTRSMRT